MKNRKNYLQVLLVIFFVAATMVQLNAQCPMCRMSAESNLANGGTMGNSLNAGILYLLALPYTLFMVLGYVWYKNRKAENEDFDPSDN